MLLDELPEGGKAEEADLLCVELMMSCHLLNDPASMLLTSSKVRAGSQEEEEEEEEQAGHKGSWCGYVAFGLIQFYPSH